MQLQAGHGFVGRFEGALEHMLHLQRPVEVIGVLPPYAVLADCVDTTSHRPPDGLGMVENDIVATLGVPTQGCADELIQ